MAWLLFMDECGHDHQDVPYEVRGGFAIADKVLWPFVQDVLRLELECFGARLSDYKSEIKGTKLLAKDRFKNGLREPVFDHSPRQALCRQLLQGGLEKRPPGKLQLTAYGQASLRMVDGIFDLLDRHKARIFASTVPRGAGKPAKGAAPPPDILRKDHIFLLERFCYFLEKKREMGLIVMDEVEKSADRKFVQRLHDYFLKTDKGRYRSKWIVPSPFFVASDMALPVQVADVVIYALSWGYRHPSEMMAETRKEIADRYGQRIEQLKWKGDGYDGTKTFKSFGIVCVPDLYKPRK